jgi:phosphatidylglycerophosphate synthase
VTESYVEVLQRLNTAQKGRARGAPAYSIYVNRRIGRFLAAAAYKAGLTPNQVTGVSAVFTFTGIAMIALAPGSIWAGVAIWVLLALGYAWDSADGQVARLRGGGSLDGEWLDHVVDAAKVISIHLAVLIGLYRHGELDDAWMLVPLGYATVNGVTFFAMILNDLLKTARGSISTAARGGSSPLRSLALLPTDYGWLCAVFVLWGSQEWFVGAYTATFALCSGFLVLAGVRWFREMKRLSAEQLQRQAATSGSH